MKLIFNTFWWAGLVLAKVRLILAKDLLSKKIKGGWAIIVLAKIKLILVKHLLSKKIKGDGRD